MNNTENFEPTGYQDDHSNGPASVMGKTSTTEGKPVKKKSSKALFIFLGVFVLLAGAVGYMLLGGMGKKQAAKPRPAASAPKEEAPVKDPNEVAAPAVDPNAVDPNAADPFGATAPVEPNAPAIDPMTGLPAAPAVAPSAIDPATGLPLAAPAIDPVTGQPLTQPAAPVADPNAPVQQPVDPLAGLPAAPVVDPAAQPVATPVPDVTAPVAPVVSAPVTPAPTSVDPLAQFRDMLAPIDGRVTNLESETATLKKDVTRLDRSVSQLLANRPSARTASAPRRQPAAPRPVNSVRVEPRVAPPVSRVIIEGGEARAAQAPQYAAAPTPEADGGSCQIQAIVQGRVWVKASDGSFSSFGEGDSWSNGQRIEAIDPQKGVRVGSRWICM